MERRWAFGRRSPDTTWRSADRPAHDSTRNLGYWESSGIVDASSVFGPGAFFVTSRRTRCGSKRRTALTRSRRPDANSGKDYTFKREGGQLALIYLSESW